MDYLNKSGLSYLWAKIKSTFALKKIQAITLSTSWSGSGSPYSQTVSVSGITANSIVVVSPTPASAETYAQCGVYCSAQASGTLTFVADTKPSANLSVNIVNLGDA